MSGGRQLQSWIDGFSEYTEGLPSPEIFRYWAGIAAIAGALERRCWLRAFGLNLYPNLYTILTGPPGVGKTVLTATVSRLWSELTDHHIAPTSVSAASFRDTLADARRRLVRLGEDPPFIEYNALAIASNELGSFMPAWDGEFVAQITDVWDGHPLRERKRGKDLKLTIDRPCVNLLAATTPSWLMQVLPPTAWEGGFTSRTLFIYSGETIIKDLWGFQGGNEKIWRRLVTDMKQIGEMYGEFSFAPEAAEALKAWHMAGGPPQPDHPKLINYVTRRTTHLLKLCMAFSASRATDLRITHDDYILALDALTQMEYHLPDIFRAMASGGDSKAMEEAWHFVYKEYNRRGQKPVLEHSLIAFLRERVPSHAIMRVVDIMLRSKMITPALVGTLTAYTPGAKRD